LAKGYKYVLAASTTTGKNILPRVAALLDVSMITDTAEPPSAATGSNAVPRTVPTMIASSD
jgi:electron transfer flavoprotein alpha subunit